MGWNALAVTTTGANLVADLEYNCQGGDPVSNGIFIASPFDEISISLRFNDWSLVDGEGASLDDGGNPIDLDYFIHLVVQPVLKSYEVPVAERMII